MSATERVSLEVYSQRSRLTIGEVLTQAAAGDLQLYWNLLVGQPMCRVTWVERVDADLDNEEGGGWRPSGIPAYGKDAPIRTGLFALSLKHNPALEYCFLLMTQGYSMSDSNFDGEPDALVLQDVDTSEWWCVYAGQIGEPDAWAWPKSSELLVQLDASVELAEPMSKSTKIERRLSFLHDWFKQQNKFTSETLSSPRTGRKGARSECWRWLEGQGITANGQLFGGARDGNSAMTKKFSEAWAKFLKGNKNLG